MGSQEVVITIRAADQATDAMRGIANVFAQAGSSIEGSMGGSLGRLSSMMLSPQTAAVATMAAIGAAAYKLGTDWEATVFKMEAVFGAGADAMIEKAKWLSETTGDLFTTQDFASAFAKVADVLDTMGLTADQQFQVVAAAADIAAVRGLNLEETVTGVAKALGGAGKAGMQFGITLKDNYMQTMAFGGSLKDVWTHLSATDKEGLRFQEFLNQTSKLSGDATEKSRTLGGEVKALGNELKEAFTPGGPGGQWANIFAGVPALGLLLTAMGDLWDSENKLTAATIGQKSAQAAANTELSNAATLMNKLTTAAADYQGRTGPEKQADFQRQINVELTNQTSLEQRLKTLTTEKLAATQQEAALQEQLANAPPLTLNLLNPNYGIEKDIIDQIAAARGRQQQAEAAIAQTNFAITASMDKQNQLAWAQVSAIAAEAQKMAYNAALTGTTSSFDTPAYQKDVTALLNDQEAGQKKIIALEQQEFNLKYAMQNLGLGAEDYAAAAAKLLVVDAELERQKSLVNYISDVLKGLETVRLNALADSMDFSKVLKQVADLQNTINTLHQVRPSFDTSVMEAQLTELTNKVFAFQANVQKALAAMGAAALTKDQTPLVPKIDDTQALSVAAQIGQALANAVSNLPPVVLNMQMAMSPAVPFKTGYDVLMAYFGAIPRNMMFTINTLIAGGETAATALSNWDIIKQYSPILAQAAAQEKLATESMSQLAMAFGANADIGALQSMKYAAQGWLAQNAENIYKAQLEMAAAQTPVPAGANAAGSTGTGTTTSSTTAGIILDCVANINVGEGKTGMDTAITIATQLDGLLAGMILSKRSQIVVALQKMGLMK